MLPGVIVRPGGWSKKGHGHLFAPSEHPVDSPMHTDYASDADGNVALLRSIMLIARHPKTKSSSVGAACSMANTHTQICSTNKALSKPAHRSGVSAERRICGRLELPAALNQPVSHLRPSQFVSIGGFGSAMLASTAEFGIALCSAFVRHPRLQKFPVHLRLSA
jgi:hypothetical protein